MRIITQMLTQSSWAVAQAHDAATALRNAANASFDLFLLDVFLDNDNSLRHLKKFRERSDLTAIAVMSAGSGKVTGEAALSAARQVKADYFLLKPFSRPELETVLKEVEASVTLRRRTPRVVVIDDSSTIRAVIRTALREDGLVVSEAESMEDAFARIDLLRVDLVITDIFMPGMGGMAGIGLLKSTWPDVAVVAMSSGIDRKWEATSVLKAAEALGAAAVLEKPFKPQQVRDVVQQILRNPNRKDASRVSLEA